MHKSLSYDDVLLQPKKSPVDSLSEVDTSVDISGIELDLPILSAPMDTVTEREMAEEMAEEGGLGVVHRFLEPDEQAEMIEGVDPVAGAVGLDEYERADKLVDAGVDMLVADIAHGHHNGFLEYLSDLDSKYDVPICAGNVATYEGAKDLSEAGADLVKVGVGPGAACTTREMTGAGVPQFSAVYESSKVDVPVVADGGIRKPGDMVKALMAGADVIMAGSLLSDTEAAPRDGQFRGMSTKTAAEDRSDREMKESDNYEEGEVMESEGMDSVEEIFERYRGGLKSGLSYCGAFDIYEARENADFLEVTNSTQYRNGAHGKD